MEWMRNQWNEWQRYPRVTKIVLIGAISVLGVVILADRLLLNGRILEVVQGVQYVLIALLLVALFMVAGAVVIRALFHVAAGLSLTIFLAQSYCGVAGPNAAGDASLQVLLVVALAYIVFDFLRILYKALEDYMSTFKRFERTWDVYALAAILLFFVAFLIWAVYLVVEPIILNLCIFTR